MTATSLGIPENIAKFLSYVLGWLSGLVMLVLERQNQQVRYHAAQSVVIFLFLVICGAIASITPGLAPALVKLVSLVSVVVWIAMMVLSLMNKAPKFAPIEPIVKVLLNKS